MQKIYCDKCGDEMEVHPHWDSTKTQKVFSFLDICVDMENPLKRFRIGAIPSVGHTTEICKDCWGEIMAKVAHGEFTLSVNHSPIYREAQSNGE